MIITYDDLVVIACASFIMNILFFFIGWFCFSYVQDEIDNIVEHINNGN